MRIDIEQIERVLFFLTGVCLVGICSILARVVHAETPARHGYVMHIQMTPAVCAFDPARKKQRKCLEGYALTVGGLVPENVHAGCETNSSATLSPLQAKVVARIIPDEVARVQLWHNVGGCMSMNATQYFRTIINYAQDLKIPAVLTDTTSHTIAKTNLEKQFLHLNPRLPADGIVLFCQSNRNTTFLTHISVCYKTNGGYKACTPKIVSNCPNNFTIQGIY